MEYSTPQNVGSSYKYERTSERPCIAVPRKGILLDAFKTMENRLQQNGKLPTTSSVSFNPLWFLAETERNVFLWRKGCSLVQLDEFEFWLDAQALIEKRLRQLSQPADSPFMNPLFGVAAPTEQHARLEQDYLHQLQDILKTLGNHMHALSAVNSILHQELDERPVDQRPELVMLPRGKRSKS